MEVEVGVDPVLVELDAEIVARLLPQLSVEGLVPEHIIRERNPAAMNLLGVVTGFVFSSANLATLEVISNLLGTMQGVYWIWTIFRKPEPSIEPESGIEPEPSIKIVLEEASPVSIQQILDAVDFEVFKVD